MKRKALYYREIAIFIIIWLTSIYKQDVSANSIHVPGWFMKNEGQFQNDSRYCLKSASSSTFFFDQYLVHQFISEGKNQDSSIRTMLNLRIDFINSNPHPYFE